LNRLATTAISFLVKLIPESYVARLDLTKVFGRIAPLQVDLGCGDGSFLVALAERHPEKNFLGIERMSGRVEKACRKASRTRNVRVLHLESSYAVERLIPPGSVEAFYLMFPDPWPKRRHQRRRVVTLNFLKAVHTALEENGILRIATDQSDYFSYIRQFAQQSGNFAPAETNGEFPPSTFETRFLQRGIAVYRSALQKVSPLM
jgi:tRNA (guanine-N7-)-methyltransferase